MASAVNPIDALLRQAAIERVDILSFTTFGPINDLYARATDIPGNRIVGARTNFLTLPALQTAIRERMQLSGGITMPTPGFGGSPSTSGGSTAMVPAPVLGGPLPSFGGGGGSGSAAAAPPVVDGTAVARREERLTEDQRLAAQGIRVTSGREGPIITDEEGNELPVADANTAIIIHPGTPGPAQERQAESIPADATPAITAAILKSAIFNTITAPVDAAKQVIYGAGRLLIATISKLAEAQVVEKNTILGFVKQYPHLSADNFEYEHEIMEEILKQIGSARGVTDPGLFIAASDAFTAGKQVNISMFGLCKTLIALQKQYRKVDARTATEISNRRNTKPTPTSMLYAAIDELECDLLRRYIILINDMRNKYSKRRLFVGAWVTTPASVRAEIMADKRKQSMIRKLLGLIPGISYFTSSVPAENTNMSGGLSQTVVADADKTYGEVSTLVSDSEIRMINALITSIITNIATCDGDIKGLAARCLETRELDIYGIINAEIFDSLIQTCIRYYTTSRVSPELAAALAPSPRNIAEVFGEERLNNLSAASEGILGGPIKVTYQMIASELARSGGYIAGTLLMAPVNAIRASYNAIAGVASSTSGAVKGVFSSVSTGFGNSGAPAALSTVGHGIGLGVTAAGMAVGRGIKYGDPFASLASSQRIDPNRQHRERVAYQQAQAAAQRSGGGGVPLPAAPSSGTGTGLAGQRSAFNVMMQAPQTTRGVVPSSIPSTTPSTPMTYPTLHGYGFGQGPLTTTIQGGMLSGSSGGGGGGISMNMSQGGGYRRRTHKRKHRVTHKHKLKPRHRQSTVHRKRKTRRS